MDDKEEKQTTNTPNEETKESKASLIDAENNVYVLAKPHDFTAQYEDATLLHDFFLLWLLALFLGYTFKFLFKLPAFLGYILAGIVLGPSGFNLLRNLVQIGTISQMGVVFMLFTLGLEFYPEKIKSIWRVSLVGGSAFIIFVILLSIAGFVFWLGRGFQEGIILGMSLALSSTAVIVQ